MLLLCAILLGIDRVFKNHIVFHFDIQILWLTVWRLKDFLKFLNELFQIMLSILIYFKMAFIPVMAKLNY